MLRPPQNVIMPNRCSQKAKSPPRGRRSTTQATTSTPSPNHIDTARRSSQVNSERPKIHGVRSMDMNQSANAMIITMKGNG